MFWKPVEPVDEPLEKAIDDVLREMRGHDVTSDEYTKCVKQLRDLYDLRPKRVNGVSPDVMLTVAGNLLGIVLIVGHERAHVVTSKALAFVRQIR